MFVSICIPSYNRPIELKRLLNSIDCNNKDIEIVICEDKAPLRDEVRNIVQYFINESLYKIRYIENEMNLGYDGNLRKLISVATGDFIIFMGDDDRFFPGALENYIDFLKINRKVSYILRSYYAEHLDGKLEIFKYFPSTRLLESSIENSAFLFKRTVSIAGVTFKRIDALKLDTNIFDGSLLYQLYLVLEISFNSDTIFCDIPFAIVAQTFRLDKPNFGASKSETKFTAGKVTPDNSIAFTNGFFEISSYFDKKYNTNITSLIRKDLSKYSYPILSIQRKNGFFHFLKYSYNLGRKTKINNTFYYYLYTLSLLFFGETLCDNLIIYIKNKIGHTPNL